MKIKKNPSILKNYIYNLSYQVISIILPFITTPYVSRHLGASAIGAYSYTNTIATYFSLFGIAGLNVYGQLQIAKIRDDKEKLNSLFWEIEFCKIITSLISIICYLPIIINSEKYKVLFLIFLILLIANIFDISWYYQGVENFGKIVVRNYIIKIISIIMIFTIVKTPNDIYKYALIIQASTLLGNISLWGSLIKYGRKYIKINNKIFFHLKRSLPFFLPAIASSVYLMMDKIMLGLIIGSDYENGIYEQAHKIEGMIITIITSLNSVLLPRTTYLLSKNNVKEYNLILHNILGAFGLITMPMMCGLFSISEVFVPVFLGEDFYGCVNLVKIFSILLFFSGANTVIGNQCLVAKDKQKQYNIGVCSGAIVNVMFNAFLIYYLKSIGAAIASVIAEMTIFVIFICCSKNVFSVVKVVKDWMRYFIGAIIMGVIVYYIGRKLLPSVNVLILQLIVGSLIYLCYLFIINDKILFKLIETLEYKRKSV